MDDIGIVQTIVRIVGFAIPALLYSFVAVLLVMISMVLGRLQEYLDRKSWKRTSD